jgi:drug/metabolite transporter (DMT)-like permease
LADRSGYALLAFLSVIWGLAFVAIRVADFELSWQNLTLLRWILVSACFLVLYPFIVKPKARLVWTDVPRLLVVSLANVAVYHLSLNFAEKTVSASLSGLLISLGPLFTVILSTLLLNEKVGRRLALGVVLALTGAVLISLPDIDLGFATLIGPLAVVLAALANGVYAVVAKPLVSKYGAIPVVTWASLLGTAAILPLVSGSLFQEASALSFDGWVSVLYLVILSTVVGNLIFYILIGRGPLSKLGVQLYLIPLVSVVGGILILGETIGALTIVGGAFILLAVGMATGIRR